MEEETWVQCDSINCQKWRRVLSHEMNDIAANSKWFCFMNSDLAHNTCESPEEDYASYDKLARKIGLKYVFSELDEGALVWATVVGYCRLVLYMLTVSTQFIEGAEKCEKSL